MRTNLKKIIKKNFNILAKLYRLFKFSYFGLLGRIDPVKLAKLLYRIAHPGYHMNLSNPINFDEKINWLKFYSDTSTWSKLTDKYSVRTYVKDKGLGFTLNPLYGVYDNANQIDFDKLPNQFVLKSTNGGSGVQVIIVRDKKTLDITKVKKILTSWLNKVSPLYLAEPHYLKIKPRLLAEKYLEDDKKSSSIIDYKFNCFNGVVYSVFLCSDREKDSVKYSVYDLKWKLYPEKVIPEYRTDVSYPKPVSLGKMIEYSKTLSQGFPFVRIDWYEINNEPVFSEMTFTPGGGYQQFYTMEYLNELGAQLNLPK